MFTFYITWCLSLYISINSITFKRERFVLANFCDCHRDGDSNSTKPTRLSIDTSYTQSIAKPTTIHQYNMADTVEVTPSSSPVVDDSMDQSPSPDASPSPSSDAAMQESENENEPDEEGDEPSGGRWGKKNTKPKVPLPVYTPLWSPVAHLSSTRRSLSDVALAPRRTEHLIQEGDTVIAYESRVSMSPLVIKKGQVYGNRFGSFHHSDMIGLPLGSRVSARGKSKGWIALLPFAPDLWTLSLTHRTQILYQADISYILFQLDLKPGDVVFESGTGSGSLTTALATTVKPHGHVHTFEFNADRVKKAKYVRET